METLNCEILSINEVRIVICQISENMDIASEMNKLPYFYFQELEKFNTDKRKREFITARLALKMLLDNEARIVYDVDGKPHLNGNMGYISISHSRSYLVLIYHPFRPVGIDIECPSERVLKLYKRYLNKIEQKYFADNLLKLQLAWSVKEAVYKIGGKEFVDFAASMLIRDFEVLNNGKIYCENPSTGKVFEIYYIVRPEYNLAYLID